MSEIAIFYCQHQTEQVNGVLKILHGPLGLNIRKVALPCSGKLEAFFLFQALEHGADGAALFGCPEGECRYLVGSTRAKNRIGYAQKILREIGWEQDRVRRFIFENQNQRLCTDSVIAWLEKIQAMGSLHKPSPGK